MPRIGKGLSTNLPTWNQGTTTTIRVPVAMKEKLLSMARAIDDAKTEVLIVDKDTYVKALNVLESALNLKPNAGGAIKTQIKDALELLRIE